MAAVTGVVLTREHLFWYLTRGTGIVSLVLLSASMVLGAMSSARLATRNWPRVAYQDLHRRISLLAVVFVAVHITTTVVDGYVPVGWISAVVPWTSPYKSTWLSLGAIAFDLMLAVTITSLLRTRISAGTWRAVHLLAYLSWPIALIHGLGMGTDRDTAWVLWLNGVCVAVVVAALAWRLLDAHNRRATLRRARALVGP